MVRSTRRIPRETFMALTLRNPSPRARVAPIPNPPPCLKPCTARSSFARQRYPAAREEGTAGLTRNFLQQRDLSGMVELVLHRPVQHMVEVVIFSWHLRYEAEVGHGENTLGQLGMALFKIFQRTKPS